jgi:hypothetical protein
MNKSTLLIISFLALLVAGVVVISLKAFSVKAAAPSAAANPTPPAFDSPTPQVATPRFRLTVAPNDPSSRQPTLSVLSVTKSGESAAAHPAPGVYTAKPHTGIVVIPGLVDDDFVKPTAPGPNMRMVEPSLQLEPRSR